jgi:hypothetical protein
MVHSDKSADNSDQHIPATSARRCSVSNAIRKNSPIGYGMRDAARHTSATSESVKTRSRSVVAAGIGSPSNGLPGTRRRLTAHVNNGVTAGFYREVDGHQHGYIDDHGSFVTSTRLVRWPRTSLASTPEA